MRARILDVVAIMFGFLLIPFSALAEQKVPVGSVFKDEPSAHALYGKMLDTMRKAETMYYESEYQWEAQGKTLGHCTYKLWMKKPNCARLEAKSAADHTSGIMVGDGEYFWIYWPNGRPLIAGEDLLEWGRTRFTSYMKIPSPPGRHSIAHEIDRLGVGTMMTILEPSVFHGYQDPMDSYLDGVKGLGTELVGEEECDVIEVSFMDHQRSRYYWLSKKDHLPRKLKEVIRVEYNMNKQELWSNVQIDREIALDNFVWKPDKDWVEYREPEIEERLLKPGTTAPDFQLRSSSGKRLKLSDYRGRVVWLVFWRVGCQGCREGLVNLKGTYRQCKKKGLVAVGFNCADRSDIALEFLRKLSISFPNVIDSSDDAKRVFFQDYQEPGMSAVPLTYIIDKEGKVVDAWYGLDEKDMQRAVKTVQELLSK